MTLLAGAQKFPETGVSRPVWLSAAAGALSLHLLIALWAWAGFSLDESDDEVGAPALEIAMEMAGPQREVSELPPGPEAEASAASPAVMEQKKTVEQADRPKDDPTESETPDRIVSPNATKTPQEETPDTATVQTSPSQESVASEATAPAVMETPRTAPKPVAPVQGLGASAQRIRATWQKRLVAHLDRHKRYPASGERHNAQVLVSFRLDRSGHVVQASVLRSSGWRAFDEAALAMMRRSDPVPAPPPVVADEELSFTVPIVFRAKS